MKSAKSLGQILGVWLTDSNVADIEINGLCIDSRKVNKGDLFFAYPGDGADGRDYIGQAISHGAVAVLCEPGVTRDAWPVPVIYVDGLREKVGPMAERFFDAPGEALFIVGITGTNGKTSCAHLMAQALVTLGVNSGLIGTLGWGFIDDLQKNLLTTPDPVSLHGMLKTLKDRGATHVCMEVSSHALAQGRVSGISFDAALFTNLTHDHLDYHNSFDSYADVKARLFTSTDLRFAVINGDDEFGRELVRSVTVPTWTYGLRRGDVKADNIEAGIDGLNLKLVCRAGPISAHAGLVGRVNVHNVLAVAALLLADGTTSRMVAKAIDHLTPVPGRMELFQRTKGSAPSVVVDYAHTPDALERALASIREHCTGGLWCVFGCGGDRDRVKRPLMGAIAERLADVIVVTDDNPRHENPRDITDEIVMGMTQVPRVINDRVCAIQWAIEHAKGDDWVLIAGKGHETTQQIGDEYIDMDDRAIVSVCLEAAA